jgi:hypothetical protein
MRWGFMPYLQYEKKIKKFDWEVFILIQNLKKISVSAS